MQRPRPRGGRHGRYADREVAEQQTPILYDLDCGLCRFTLGTLLAWDRENRLRPVPLQDPEADRLLGDMEEGKKMSSWHLIDDQGRVHSAGEGLSELFRLLPGGRPLAELFGRFPGASERFYFAIANNRDRVGPKIPRSWVERATRRVDRRRGAR